MEQETEKEGEQYRGVGIIGLFGEYRYRLTAFVQCRLQSWRKGG